MRFVAVGELLVDVLATGADHEAHVRVRPGGSAFNSAAAAVAAGAEATAVGTVGDDAAGRLIRDELTGRGVHTEIAVVPGSTGTFLLVDGQIRVDRGVSRHVSVPDRIDADVVLVSGYLAPETIEAALAAAHARWAVLDAARLAELPRGGNAIVANAECARRLTGLADDEAARALGARYRLACVTRGAGGAVAVLDERLETAAVGPAPDEGPGAGDAFAATLLVGLAHGHDLGAALAEACRAGACAAAQS